jgi:hypothetical protein
MRKTLLLTMILLVFAAWAVAQQGSAAQGAPTHNDQQAPQAVPANIIDGCLGGSAGNFTVTDNAGTTYQLQLPPNADTTKLSQHIGEEVRVSGDVSNAAGAASGAAAPGSTSAGSSAAGGQPSINVTKMDKIGSTCGNSTSGGNPSK